MALSLKEKVSNVTSWLENWNYYVMTQNGNLIQHCFGQKKVEAIITYFLNDLRMRIKVILFDFIGTVVKEKDSAIVASCLSSAFIEHGIFLNSEFFNSQKGKDNIDIIRDVLDRYRLPISMIPGIYSHFKKKLKENIENFSASEDSLRVISHLLRIGVLIGIKTNLPKEVFDDIYLHLGWTKKALSYIGFSGEIDKGSATGDMIFDMMSKLEIENPSEILKVGDSIESIKEGKKTGCRTAVLLSHIQLLENLIKEKPDFLLNSLFNIVNLVLIQNAKVNEVNNSRHSLIYC